MRWTKARRPPKPARPDPFDLAAVIRRRDLEKLATELWDKKGLPPSWLASRTPHEFAAMFFHTSAEDGEVTLAAAVGELTAANRNRGERRERPLIPPSLLAELNPRRPPPAALPVSHDGFVPLGATTIVPAGVAPAVRA